MMEQGVVIKSTGSIITVLTEKGTFSCTIKGNFRIKNIDSTNPVAVGDKVKIEIKDGETNLISELLDRKNYIVRKSVNLSKQVQVLASNIDKAYVIATPVFPKTSTGFIDRFLSTAEAYSIPAAIIFNKSDLFDPAIEEYVDELKLIYAKIGYEVFCVSALQPKTIIQLQEELKNKINLFLGHSGVGKSTLINALIPGLNLKTAPISTQHLKGTHTTTFAEMHPLPQGGYIIDTPGIREFGITDFNKQEVTHYFPEFFRLLGNCKYNNCMHVNESDCAVIKALKNGEVSESRYRNYLSILNNEDFHK